MEDNFKISIIIPIYNVEKHLKKCLDSVINQTYKNIEIICVNDGSKDTSKAIIEEYSKKDIRIKLINQNNAGGIIARKNGFEKSIGDYCLIIDSDDWIELNTIEFLVDKINKYREREIILDFIRFGYITEPGQKHVNYINDKEKFYTGEEIKLLYKDLICGNKLNSIWNVLLRRDLINFEDSIFDYIVHKAEDLAINMSVYKRAKNALLINNDFYHYFQNPNGITKTASLEKIKSNIKDYVYLYNKRLAFNDEYKLNISINLLKNILVNSVLKETIKLLKSNNIKKDDFYNLEEYMQCIELDTVLEGYDIRAFRYNFLKKYCIKCILKNDVKKLYKFRLFFRFIYILKNKA